MMVGEWMSEWLCNEQGVSWESEEKIYRENMSTSADQSLTAVQENICRENMSTSADHSLSAVRNFKLVLAEPLPDHPHSHVNNFIRGK